MNPGSRVHEITIWNVMNMGPVKPDLPVRTMTLILRTFTRNHMKIKLETLVFNLHLWHFGVHDLLPSIYPSVVHPIIRRPEEPALDPVIGLPSPGALEKPPGISRTLSSVAVTGEPGPGSGPNTSGSSSSDIQYGRSSGASSTSIGCCRMLLTAEANSDSDRVYQSSLMFVMSWIPNSSSIDSFSELVGVPVGSVDPQLGRAPSRIAPCLFPRSRGGTESRKWTLQWRPK